MMRFAAIREQVAKERGVSHFLGKGETTNNNLTLNYAPNMTPEQKAALDAIYLAGLNGKAVDALPVPTQATIIETEPA